MEYEEIICDNILQERGKPEYQSGTFKFKNKYVEVYILDSLLHNENGPAYLRSPACYPHSVIDKSGEYWLYGIYCSKEEWEKQMQTKLYW